VLEVLAVLAAGVFEVDPVLVLADLVSDVEPDFVSVLVVLSDEVDVLDEPLEVSLALLSVR
jgi:hypothetical protein